MKVGIIGGGVTGLATAYYLTKKGYQVTVFEKENFWGGVAASFSLNSRGKTWPLECFYHHLFTTDKEILDLISEIGLSKKLTFKSSKTGVFFEGREYPFATPWDILRFKPLGFGNRLRLGLVTLYLKAITGWKGFEQSTACEWLERFYGKQVCETIWFPLLRDKFGKYWREISMVWFWARIKKRSFRLGYLEGSFQVLTDALVKQIKEGGGDLRPSCSVLRVGPSKGCKIKVSSDEGEEVFDRVVSTVPTPVFLQFVQNLPRDYRGRLGSIRFLWAQSLVLVLNHSLVNSYWLNINEEGFPFLALVEHTNFVPPENYEGSRVIYLGNYFGDDDRRLKMTKEELLEFFTPYIKRVNPAFSQGWVREVFAFKSPFAQHIVGCDYKEQSLVGFKTPVENLYLATQAQVYPWDRGTNFAVKLAKDLVDKDFPSQRSDLCNLGGV